MIEKVKHYSINTPTFPSVYDQEAMTALELVGRLGGTVNECVDVVNTGSAKLDTYEQRLADAEGRSINAEETALNAIVTANSAHNVATGAASTAAGAAATAASAETIARAASTTAGEAGATALEAQRRAHNAELSALDAGGLASSAATAAINAGDAAAEAKAEALSAATAAAAAVATADSVNVKTLHVRSATMDYTIKDPVLYRDQDPAFTTLRITSPVFEVTAFMYEKYATPFDFTCEISDEMTPSHTDKIITYHFKTDGGEMVVECALGTATPVSVNLGGFGGSSGYPAIAKFGVNREFHPYITIKYSDSNFKSHVFTTLAAGDFLYDAFAFEQGNGYDNIHPVLYNNNDDTWDFMAMLTQPTSAPIWVLPQTDVVKFAYDLYPLSNKFYVVDDFVADSGETQTLHSVYVRLNRLFSAGCIPEKVVIITPDYDCDDTETVRAERAQADIIGHLCEEYGVEVYVTVPYNGTCADFVSGMYGSPHYINLANSVAGGFFSDDEAYDDQTFPYYLGGIITPISYVIMQEVL